ncbi:MAG TPA: hypothetical protein VKS22_02085 [Candidatus Binataceae bacterium]|nr:hypothetical protein [Candidatus Binataceae bacterium]
MVRRLLPLILIQLAGCASAPPFLPPAEPVEVRIPVDRPVYCAAPPPARPVLPIGALRTGSSPAETLRSYAATVIILKGAVRERDTLIAGCAAPPAPVQGQAATQAHK